MQKKYIVRLTDEERQTRQEVVKKLKGSSQKLRRAQILLKADADGPAWTDKQIAQAFDCRTKTAENIRQRLVTDSLETTLSGKQRETPARTRVFDGEQEAKVIALRLGPPPKRFANWTLRLLAEKVVELEIVPAVSHETLRRALKKRHEPAQDPVRGDSAEGQIANLSRAWKKCWRPMPSRATNVFRCCAWMSNRCH